MHQLQTVKHCLYLERISVRLDFFLAAVVVVVAATCTENNSPLTILSCSPPHTTKRWDFNFFKREPQWKTLRSTYLECRRSINEATRFSVHYVQTTCDSCWPTGNIRCGWRSNGDYLQNGGRQSFTSVLRIWILWHFGRMVSVASSSWNTISHWTNLNDLFFPPTQKVCWMLAFLCWKYS